MTRGDAVILTIDGREIEGTIILASGNGRSLAIEFDAIVGNWVGGIAVMKHDDGSWRAIDGTLLAVRPARLGA